MHCAVFKKTNKSIPVSPEYRKLIETDTEGRTKKKNVNEERFMVRELQNDSPVFYLGKLNDRDEIEYFGSTVFFRTPYRNSIGKYVSEKLNVKEKIDIAEAMFGDIEGKDRIIKGRLKYEDAVMVRHEGDTPFLGKDEKGERAPMILGQPKPTAIQNYLDQTSNKDKRKILNWNSSTNETRIRGYKRYWHKENIVEFEYDKKKWYDSQHVVIRPVNRNVVFNGKIKFDNLTYLELGALLAALDIPKNMRHHIGMGKPRGMGSIEIKPTLKIIDRNARYNSFQWNESTDGKPIQKSKLTENDVRNQALFTYLREFSKFYKSESNVKEGSPEDEIINAIWELPRNKELANMMEWTNAPDPNKTSYPPIGSKNKEEAKIWSERKPLGEPKDYL